MESNKKVKLLSIISFFLIAILGTFLHFSYKLSGNNLFIDTFSAINESVFEHLKILVFPMFFALIYEYFFLVEKKDKLFIANLTRILTAIIVVLVIHYTYMSIVGEHIAIIDILTFYLSILLSQINFYHVINVDKNLEKINKISLIVCIVLLILLVTLTYFPPKLGLFKDKSSSTYCIFNKKGGIRCVKTNLETWHFSVSSTCSTCYM